MFIEVCGVVELLINWSMPKCFWREVNPLGRLGGLEGQPGMLWSAMVFVNTPLKRAQQYMKIFIFKNTNEMGNGFKIESPPYFYEK